MKRVEALVQIITFGECREPAFSALCQFGFDSDVELVEISDSILADVLQLFIAGFISADELEEWANFIECRDDINFARNEGYIYALSNPELMGEINTEKIIKMLEVLMN
ncbi:hypothetical protein SAMN05421760_102437 [Neptunomonas antarctica]|uniref:Uncharacterized protein n=2 Tax=Neptunomonas antarctica TaxID=619304 RepID=A0A1N7KH45_9GAMM|nr:hypothetical protein SAMN05421760_102437 [Neptunomonas antarctica]